MNIESQKITDKAMLNLVNGGADKAEEAEKEPTREERIKSAALSISMGVSISYEDALKKLNRLIERYPKISFEKASELIGKEVGIQLTREALGPAYPNHSTRRAIRSMGRKGIKR